MKSEQIAETHLAYLRVTGPYGENYEPAVELLYRWAGENHLQGGQCLFIYHDDPETTELSKCRTDICLTVPAGTTASGNVGIQVLSAGRYCMFREIVRSKSEYPRYWKKLLDQVKIAGLEVDERPCFELYHSYDIETHVADVGFYVAVKG
ncbi:AraC family transcriptional regulator [Photobacterium sp. DNB23_23_1]|uniref:GyrI-like domain-containing protein n=1 Tax=Photobacterium pectinilyticum TaxID=2906793 RepID=A0ABT1N527_9GAMM|nr:GyrI-like domain-containing protein [Photobacterium sp. ZSDE20]MCQ1058841.1 GyrI-like domain-containing protein [Photobacterium sp. ZSDE20]MDD1823869.1 GyrI-like domain-containing protein [Photobacterium sp. ZSDE20]